MSSFQDLDPRLRDSSGTTLSASIAANPSISPAGQQQYPHIQDGSSQQNIYPDTPQSAGNTAQDGPGDAQDGGVNDPKRPRACEACRGLKVRCEPDPIDPDGPCKRCKKANRQCVVTVPSRKRQKKTDSRVAELEKKIDALTASLHATKSNPGSVAENEIGIEQESMNVHNRHNPYQQVTNGGYGSRFTGRPETRMPNEWSAYPSRAPEFEVRKPPAPPMVVAGQKRKHTENRDYLATSPDTRSPSVGGPPRRSFDAGPQQTGFSNCVTGFQTAKTPQTYEYADVVDRGLITAEMAAKMFSCYVEKMAFHMPGVVFSPGTTAADIRKSKPTLFLAILSASSGMNYPEYQRMLTKEVMSIYADRIICNGEKTLELIQALHVSTLWYWPPEHFEELKFYQLIHIAAVMAIDIGMGKKSKPSKGKNAGLWRDHPWRRTPYPDPESIEARRAWLSCYFLCCNASMGLRRPNLIQWTPFMADCIEILENSTEAAHSDKILCQWVRSQHIAEDIGTQFSMDDPVASVSIADPKVQYALKGFEMDLEKWRGQMPTDIQSPSLKMTEHVVNLYMHEVAMHVDHNVDEFKPPFTEDTLQGHQPDSLTPAHIGALSACLAAIDGIFDTFLTFDVETIRCLPVLHFVRVAYAVVVLIKMYFAAAAPHSELGKVINRDDMKVELYLNGLVDIFKASSAEEKSRPSAKFLMVLIMLKTWFHRQREGKLAPFSGVGESSTMVTVPTTTRNEGETSVEAASENTEDSLRQVAQPRLNYSPANTPLQLLSEVATGNSGGQSRSDGANNYPGPSNEWPQQQRYPNYDSSLIQVPPNMAQGYANTGGNIDPALGMDLGYTMGDGFEQAMGMTLGGVGEFGNYLSDDAFFASIMDSVGGGPGFDGF